MKVDTKLFDTTEFTGWPKINYFLAYIGTIIPPAGWLALSLMFSPHIVIFNNVDFQLVSHANETQANKYSKHECYLF
jgi:hypothetical protein